MDERAELKVILLEDHPVDWKVIKPRFPSYEDMYIHIVENDKKMSKIARKESRLITKMIGRPQEELHRKLMKLRDKEMVREHTVETPPSDHKDRYRKSAEAAEDIIDKMESGKIKMRNSTSPTLSVKTPSPKSDEKEPSRHSSHKSEHNSDKRDSEEKMSETRHESDDRRDDHNHRKDSDEKKESEDHRKDSEDRDHRKDEVKKEELLRVVKPFILRRTKKSVAPDLPELTEFVHYCEMTDEQADVYEKEKSKVRNMIILAELEGGGQEKIQILNSLQRLRQIASHPAMISEYAEISSGKFEELIYFLENARQSDEKVLVFSSYVRHLEKYFVWADQNNVPYSKLTGELAQSQRKQQVENFQEKNIANVCANA